jgi:hypothetical protein
VLPGAFHGGFATPARPKTRGLLSVNGAQKNGGKALDNFRRFFVYSINKYTNCHIFYGGSI